MAQEDNGYRTYKELVRQQAPLKQAKRGFSLPLLLADVLSLGIQAPGIGWLLRRSFTIVCSALGRFRRTGNYKAFYQLLVKCLSQSTFKKKQGYRWWYLMRFAVAAAQERQINWFMRDLILEDNLTFLGNLGPRPLKGYDVAYSFVGYSLWSFERGDIWSAINLIKVAEESDPTWGYPEYLHGWYGLFTKGVDSVEHFSRAVHIDWSFLQRMKHDRTCRAHPEILHEVQKRTLIVK